MLYIIKANLILALLCLLFQVLMHRDTFFGVRRLMLWGIYATAFLLPLCNLQTLLTADTAATDMAEAYGAEGYRIEKFADLKTELEKALATPEPAFIDVRVEREENVYPMVPAGAALDEMLLV